MDDSVKSSLKLGLFSYPVLQAADILIHRYVWAHHYTSALSVISVISARIYIGYCAYHDFIEQLMFLLAKTNASISNLLASVPPTSTTYMEKCWSILKQYSVRSLSLSRYYAWSITSEPPDITPELPRSMVLIMTAPIHRIKSLRAPTQKMSKSDDNAAARILITDDPATIWKKIMAAVTDSIPSVTYDPESRPGVSNLLEILAVFDCQSRPPDVLAAELSGASLKDLKATVANSIVDGLRGVSERYLEILSGNRSYLHRVQEEGAIQARANAAETMAAVRSAIGL
jgi:hypothetical protein